MKRFFFFFVHEREFDFCLFYNERLLIRKHTQTHWYTPPRCKGCKGKGSTILRCRVLSARSSQFWSQIALKCRKPVMPLCIRYYGANVIQGHFICLRYFFLCCLKRKWGFSLIFYQHVFAYHVRHMMMMGLNREQGGEKPRSSVFSLTFKLSKLTTIYQTIYMQLCVCAYQTRCCCKAVSAARTGQPSQQALLVCFFKCSV